MIKKTSLVRDTELYLNRKKRDQKIGFYHLIFIDFLDLLLWIKHEIGHHLEQ